MLHFLSGCDDLSFLRGFSKNFCFKVFERYCDKICPEESSKFDKILSGDEDVVCGFVIRFLAYLYGYKFSSSFERGEITSLVIDNERDEKLNIIRTKNIAQDHFSEKYDAFNRCTCVSLKTIRLLFEIG